MTRTPNQVRRNIKGQATEYSLLGRLRGTGPVQFLTFDDVVTEMMSRGQLAQRIRSIGGGSGETGNRAIDPVITTPGQTVVSFTGISQIYRNMKIKILGGTAAGGTSTDGLAIRFNGDTGNNYRDEYIFSQGGSASVASTGITNMLFVGNVPQSGITNNQALFEIDIPFYVTGRPGTAMVDIANRYLFVTNALIDIAGSWASSAAITQVDVFFIPGSAFKTGTLVELILET